jgi:Chibby family
MPFGLLTNKFSPKKGLPRKSPSLSNLNIDASSPEFGVEFGTSPIKLKLGSNEMLFDGGEWVTGG